MKFRANEPNKLNKSIPWLKVTAVAAGCIIVFAILVNVCDPFAYFASRLPIMKYIVSFARLDTDQSAPGQEIQKSVTCGDLKFTVHEAYETEQNTVLSCTVDWYGVEAEEIPYLSGFEIVTDHTGRLPAGMGAVFNYDKANGKSSGTMEYQSTNEVISWITVRIHEIHLSDDKIVYGDWNLSFFIDQKKL